MTGRLSPSSAWQLLLAIVFAVLTAWSTATRPTLALVGIAALLLACAIFRIPEMGALLIIGLVAIVPRSVLFDRELPSPAAA